MRIGFADPPYPGQSAKHYADHPDYAGEVDHAQLIERLAGYDACVLHTSAPALRDVLPLCPAKARMLVWVKSFAAFKKNVKVAYAWEPIMVWGGRTPTPNRFPEVVLRDFIVAPITMRRGFVGAKPERLCHWLFEVLGCEPDDQLDDLFPGSGAVTHAWATWRHILLRDESALTLDAA